MKPAAFDYVRPSSLEAATGILEASSDAAVIAGGQSLLAMLNLRIAAPETVVDITRLPELRQITEQADRVVFGALTTHAMFEDAVVPDPARGLMQRIASKIAYRAIRNLGTIGGSLALADPSADWPACLLALDATVITGAATGRRRIAIGDFLLGAYATDLMPGEIITAVEIPRRPECRWGVGKVMRKSGAFADSLAVMVAGADGRPTRIAVTGTSSHARLMARTGRLIDDAPEAGAQELRAAIRDDIAAIHEDATPYQQRCHLSTVLSAIGEARQW